MTHDRPDFVDTIWARLLALLLALAILAALYISWGPELGDILATGEVANLPLGTEPDVKPANPALQSCLNQRVGDVDRMQSEGVISDAQYTAFRQRAEDLCRAQNPL